MLRRTIFEVLCRWSSRSCGEPSFKRDVDLRRRKHLREDLVHDLLDELGDRQLSPGLEGLLDRVVEYLSLE